MASKIHLQRLKKKTVKGTAQLLWREVGMKGIAILGQILLVRLLSPSAFGIFAILSFILGIAEIFTDIGLNLSLIQKNENASKRQISTILYIKFAMAAIAVVLLFIIAPLLHFIYPSFGPSELTMLNILSITLLLKPMQSLITSLLERDLKYKAIAIIDVSGIISYYIIAIVMANIGFGIWSFVWAVVVKTIIENTVTFIYKPLVPVLEFNLKEVRNYINVGKYFQLGLILSVIKNSTIPVMAGVNLPTAQVGLLDWSYNISSFPRVFIDNVGRVSFASFSRMQNDKKIIATSLEHAFGILSIAAIFAIPITVIFGYDTIHYFLNDRWLPALPALIWYVASIFFLNGNGLMGHALLAVGKLRLMLVVGSLITLFEILISYLLMIRLGFYGIAVGFFVSNAILFFAFIIFCRRSEISINLTKILLSNALILLLSSCCFYLINFYESKTIVDFFVKVVIATASYFTLVQVFTPKTLKLSIKLIISSFA